MKKLIYYILCNSITGFVISRLFSDRIPNIRYLEEKKRYYTDNKYVSNEIKAMIFFGFYEAAEARLIRCYMPSHLPVLEIGSSLGIISNLILSKIDGEVKLTSIEANPFLLETIESNTQYNDNKLIINKAITYTECGEVLFRISTNNTEGSLVNLNDNVSTGVIKVSTATISQFISSSYVLVSDIEGSEIDFLLNDENAMRLCSHLFIELHETNYNGLQYSVNDLSNLILNKYDFTLIARDGNVFYYRK